MDTLKVEGMKGLRVDPSLSGSRAITAQDRPAEPKQGRMGGPEPTLQTTNLKFFLHVS